ncbi:hypothetical protein [Streptomyces sp. NPDC021356]|uniref:hypothetical protein n=1 Tax=Streptomyces sp. NPDC021356 TaxID=3154900 RepID=UPI0033E29531
MPRHIDRILGQAAIPDTVTDDELDDLKQEIVRDVTAALMFGAQPAPQGHHPTRMESADTSLKALSCHLLRSGQAAEHLAGIADDPVDIDGALHFGCLLSLAMKPEGALWWWQYAAGAGNATAAYCLHLFHLRRGELRDADHWMRQALDLDFDILHAHHRTRPNRPRAPQAATLRQAVERLKVEEVCGEFHHPDQQLADQIEELAAPC